MIANHPHGEDVPRRSQSDSESSKRASLFTVRHAGDSCHSNAAAIPGAHAAGGRHAGI